MSQVRMVDGSRRVLRLSEWPESHRIQWNQAFGKRVRPRQASEGGPLPKPVSIRMWQEACGRYLGYLQREGRLNPATPLAGLVTEDNLDGYYDHLLACRCSGHTIINYFRHLRAALERMHPGETFKFITHLQGVSLKQQLDMTKRDIAPPPLEGLVAWTKDLFESGKLLGGDQRRRTQIRDAAMFAVLCEAGPRLRSITAMRAGVHLQQRREEWWLALEPEDTKTGHALRVPLEAWTWPIIERYLTIERIQLLGGASHDALWIDWGGTPLKERGVDKRVRWRSEKQFGRAFGPHMFRYSIATAGDDDGNPFGAGARLGHTDPNTTVGYTRPATFGATAKRHAAVLRDLRRQLGPLTGWDWATALNDAEEDETCA